MAKPFIHYMVKNNITYASIYTPKRVNGVKVNDPVYLGRVIDKELGIYQNKVRGQYQFSLESGYKEIENSSNKAINIKEKDILIFGDIYLCHEVLHRQGYINLFRSSYIESPDSLISLIIYKLLGSKANGHLIDWWNGTYAKILCPKATITSQYISEHLRLLGDEGLQKNLLSNYLTKLYGENRNCGILIDSAGLQNNINFELTAENNYNDQISKETRLIYVIDRETKMPIYFRYVAGNIVDVSILKNTLEELKKYNININYSIFDAGYYSKDNIKELYQSKIPFIARLIPNRKILKEFQANKISDLMTPKNAVLYENRLLYVKIKKFMVYGYVSYAYLILDAERHLKEFKDFLKLKDFDFDISSEDAILQYEKFGFFIIVSSEYLTKADILPLYYTRQGIEQIFDVSKDNTDLLHIAYRNVETFRGYLFVNFLAVISFLTIRKLFHKQNYNIIDAFSSMHYLYCKVYDDFILISEPTEKMKEIFNLCKITIPNKLLLSNI
jgi:hypothetical protein